MSAYDFTFGGNEDEGYTALYTVPEIKFWQEVKGCDGKPKRYDTPQKACMYAGYALAAYLNRTIAKAEGVQS